MECLLLYNTSVYYSIRLRPDEMKPGLVENCHLNSSVIGTAICIIYKV